MRMAKRIAWGLFLLMTILVDVVFMYGTWFVYRETEVGGLFFAFPTVLIMYAGLSTAMELGDYWRVNQL